MSNKSYRLLGGALAALSLATIGCSTAPATEEMQATAEAPAPAAQSSVRWSDAVLHRDAAWYSSAEARTLADAVLLYQSAEGGWPKNTDLSISPPPPDAIRPTNGRVNTFDNDGTTVPLAFLAHMITATGDARYLAAFNRGIDYTLEAQYENGGWPQFYPLREGYYSHITYNDDAMSRIMVFLGGVSTGNAPYAFVDAERRAASQAAIARGIDVMLKTQIRQNGRLTGWCAQHDEHTLEPAWARAYEPPSLSGGETVGNLRYLMSIENPTPEIIAAVEGGVAWLDSVKIMGMRYETFTNEAGEQDRRVVPDASAGPIWARFYELVTNRPLFLGRDSVYRYSLAEIERERRGGYNYYGNWGQRLIESEYPAWRAKHGL